MSGLQIFASVVGIIGTISAVVSVFIAYGRNKKQDNVDGGKRDGTLLTEIGYIKSGVDDIKRKQEKQDEQHIEVITRLTAVEASAKQAHLRIDGIMKN